jgi:iron complex outermembrane receptor protein
LSLAVPAHAQIEEVVVTATRREESAQTVPISITALSSERLKLSRTDAVRDLGFVTPGLNMNGRSNVWIPYIRGIGAQDTSGGQEASVSIYIDGVYMSSPHAGALAFNNIERVEVLKGPQGTLFGRNSTGGLIHIITRDPGEDLEVFGKVGYGDYETSSAQLYVGGGLTSNLRADIALNYSDQGEGFGKNVFDGTDIEGEGDEGVRTKWIWDVSDATKVTWTADWNKHETAMGDNRALLPGSVGADDSVHEGGFQDVNLNFPTYGWIKNYGTMLRFDHEFGFGNFVSISAYRKIKQYNTFDNDGLPTSWVEAQQEFNEIETFTQEFQLLSKGDGPFSWIVGAFYLNDDSGYADPKGLQIEGLQVLPIPGAYVQFVDPIKTESIAGFAEGTYAFTDSTRLTLGARYTQDKKEIGGEQRVFTVFPDILFPGAPALVTIPFDFDESWSEPTYRVAVEQDLTPDAMLYVSYNHGFRSGSFNTVGVTGAPVEPETNDAYEIGLKSQWLDNRLRFNAAAYYTEFKDLQAVISRGPSTDLINAAEAEIKGLELDLQASVSENMTLRAGASFIDAEYTEFETGLLCSTREPGGHTIYLPECSPKGNSLVRTPETSFNVGILYTKPLSFGTLGFSADYMWTDDFYWELDNRLVEPSYGLLNGTLFWTSLDEHWNVTLWGRNITDEDYSMFQVAQAGCGAACTFNPYGIGDQYAPAPPMTWGVDFNFKF